MGWPEFVTAVSKRLKLEVLTLRMTWKHRCSIQRPQPSHPKKRGPAYLSGLTLNLLPHKVSVSASGIRRHIEVSTKMFRAAVFIMGRGRNLHVIH